MSEPSPFNALGPISRPIPRAALLRAAQDSSARAYQSARDDLFMNAGHRALIAQEAAAILSAEARRQLDSIIGGDLTVFVLP